jgi:hypothetical protein
MALEPVANDANVPALLSPFFVLYDFRVAASHLTSTDRARPTSMERGISRPIQ